MTDATPKPAPDPTAKAAPRTERGRLNAAWRVASGVAALALGVFGVLAVFRTMNTAGSATMLVVAALFGVVTLLGHVPRLKFGDNEIDPSAYYLGGRDATELAKRRAEEAARREENTGAGRAAVEATSDVAELWRRAAEVSKAKAAGIWPHPYGPADWQVRELWHVGDGPDKAKSEEPKA
ncbi:hypothetical protein [Cellulomonas sp. Y8]|uniref:hypothetical protein n=1 Tax=Cellulomonas sp. Y8 TaxID=2591145 RepID=UPI003D750869